VGLANVNLVCTGDNSDSNPISPAVYNVANGNDISLIETKIENILVGNGDTVVLDAPNVTGNSVTTITNLQSSQCSGCVGQRRHHQGLHSLRSAGSPRQASERRREVRRPRGQPSQMVLRLVVP
jgi:hypothetical protein